ncbi:MAG: type II secretion system GspH family protein [Lentisphaerales bacterium]|nr:type II secretion system GspH family protein [Lentisphaerales bacterium]
MNIKNIGRFTLLELLIVISVMGILITLLFPSLTRAKEEAKLAVCGSNQKQINVGLYGYSANNSGKLTYTAWDLGENWPNAAPSDPNDHPNGAGKLGGHGVSWTDNINVYMGGDLHTWEDKLGILDIDDPRALPGFVCPSDIWGPEMSGKAAMSYGANERILGKTNPNAAPVDDNGDGIIDNKVPYHYDDDGNALNQIGQRFAGQIIDPSASFTISDAPINHRNSSRQGSTHGRHSISRLYNENSPDPKAQLMIQFWPSEEEWERLNMAALEVHRKRFNYLFVDGSVKVMNPYNTLGTGDLRKPKGIWTNAIDD